MVTGAAGRIGIWVVEELLRAGHQVLAVDRRGPSAAGMAHDALSAEWRKIDLLDSGALIEALRDVDAVVHLAAIPGPVGCDPIEVFANNTRATFAVLEAAGRAEVGRAVLASSVSALGLTYSPQPRSPIYVPIDEAHPVFPADPYALSKCADELTASAMHRRYGMTVVSLRFHWVALPGEARVRALTTPVDDSTAVCELWGYVDARDAAAACRLALQAPGIDVAVCNIAAAESLSVIPTEELVRRFHGSTELRPGLDGTASAWSIARARELLGYHPRFSWRRDDDPANPRGGSPAGAAHG